MGLRDRLNRWSASWRRNPSLGQRGESFAARFLKKQGYRILARSDRQRWGEIDLIALDGRTLVFVEVKTRRSHEKGHPADAVDEAKQRRLTRLALIYLKQHGLLEYPVRFDVVAITWAAERQTPQVQHYRHAFDATGGGSGFS